MRGRILRMKTDFQFEDGGTGRGLAAAFLILAGLWDDGEGDGRDQPRVQVREGLASVEAKGVEDR